MSFFAFTNADLLLRTSSYSVNCWFPTFCAKKPLETSMPLILLVFFDGAETPCSLVADDVDHYFILRMSLMATFAFHMFAVMGSVTTKPTPDTVHSPTPGQLHVESIQLACTCALCRCYALCMKREELLIFYSFWLRCFVDMLQYVGFLGRSQLFGSQVKVGAPTWHLKRANCIVGAPTWRANSGFGARQLPHSSSSFAPFMHSLSLLGISLYHASKATQEEQGEEGDNHRPHVCPRCTT